MRVDQRAARYQSACECSYSFVQLNDVFSLCIVTMLIQRLGCRPLSNNDYLDTLGCISVTLKSIDGEEIFAFSFPYLQWKYVKCS